MSEDSAAKFLLGLCAMVAFLIASAAVTLWKAAGSLCSWLKARRTKSHSETT